jgi:hypothetical protein
VTNFGFKPKGAYLHNTGVKLSNGWIRGGHHVINFSDRDIARWQAFLGYRAWGLAATNKLLLDICRNARPDVVAFGHADIINNETLSAIRVALPNVKMLQWNFDWIAQSEFSLEEDRTAENNKQRIMGKMPFLDATFITTAGDVLAQMSDASHPVYFMPNPVDLSIERSRNFERDDLPADVFFASNSEDDRRHHCGAWRPMAQFFSDLAAAAPDLKISLHGINGGPKVFGPAYDEAMGSCRIGLNISRRNDIPLYSSDRIAQMIGNGLVVCIDRASGYSDIFSDDEMVFYNSETELFDKLKQLKKDDGLRKRIAEAGWKRYTKFFNSTAVGQYMLEALSGQTTSDALISSASFKTKPL